MKIAVISDVHGNVCFFEQCLKAIENIHIDKIVALGDYFGYMRGGSEVVKVLVDRDAYLLKGNHEAMLLGELPLDPAKERIYGLLEDRKSLRQEYLRFLKNLQERFVLDMIGIRILFVHGSPANPITEYVYAKDIEEKFDGKKKEYDFVFMGHTHRAFIKRFNETTYINVGSCGLPRDYGLRPSVCLLDTQTKEINLIRVAIEKDILNHPPFLEVDPSIRAVFFRRNRYEN